MISLYFSFIHTVFQLVEKKKNQTKKKASIYIKKEHILV